MILRRSITVRGLVQGVGFRPYVHRLASQFGLGGFVGNKGGHVVIEVEGAPDQLAEFQHSLCSDLPRLARVEEIFVRDVCPLNESKFTICNSEAGTAESFQIGADVPTCMDCLAELFDPRDRRFRYPFLNCTNCGPRFTIVLRVPYDRQNTTMGSFPMCAACKREYEDPSNRRFHAEPIACPECGPRLTLLNSEGDPPAADDPLASVVEAFNRGMIVAIKGLGGFHLACLATDESAVAELRRRKHRDAQPFAIMVENLAAAQSLCEISADEAKLLTSAECPIVLLRRKKRNLALRHVVDNIAPNSETLGIMLPYTPLHHLLIADMCGQPLVMTSGNHSSEPIVFRDSDSSDRLAELSDFTLTHDRAIHVQCDDSIVRWSGTEPMTLRRSRGYVPSPLPLPVPCPAPILAVGGQQKVTFALGIQDRAILSQHLGDLDDFAAFEAFVAAIEHFERLFAIQPELVVHDLHPDYASTRYAIDRCGHNGSEHQSGAYRPRRIAVQHHHAHLASCLADNGMTDRVIGVIFDGTGYGSDGSIWGGEFLIGDCREFLRAAHLRNVPMPGGEMAIREPWRMGAAYLLDAIGKCDLLDQAIPNSKLDIIAGMVAKRLNSPMTSSAGRLFDGVAAICGVKHVVSYEGQAAVALEWLADSSSAVGHYGYRTENASMAEPDVPMAIDTRPLIEDLVRDVRNGVDAPIVARRFHSTLVKIIRDVCDRLRATTGLGTVALSGGVFMNDIIMQETEASLKDEGFRVLRHRHVPPNDGGLCLGQLSIAAAQLAHSTPSGEV